MSAYDIDTQSASPKIRTNLNLNFPLYCASIGDCPRKPDVSNKVILAAMKPSAEYNQRAAIIEGLRAERSATEIIRFFGYPRSTVYDIVAKYTALEQSKVPVYQRGRVTLKNARPRGPSQSLKGLKR